MSKIKYKKTNIIGLTVGVALVVIANPLIDRNKNEDINIHNNTIPLISINEAIVTIASSDNNDTAADIELIKINDSTNINEGTEIALNLAESNEVELHSTPDIEVEIPETKKITETATRGSDEIKSSRNMTNANLSQGLNQYVLDVIKSYPVQNNNYPYLLNNDYKNYNGVTDNLYYQDQLLLKAHPSGNKASHCTGITFEVFFKAMQNRNIAAGIDKDDFNGMTKDQLFDMALTWYVANGTKSQSNIAVAVEKYGLGYRITDLEKLRAGDFIDFSRENNTGHTVVFINWIKDGNKIIGLKYWSSQGSTNGISYQEEYFNITKANGQKYGTIMLDNLYMARIRPIGEYK